MNVRNPLDLGPSGLLGDGMEWVIRDPDVDGVIAIFVIPYMVIDERADESQRFALETIISGKACAPLSNHFSVFGSLCTEFLGTLYLPIDIEADLDERVAVVHIPDVLTSRGRPMINEFSGEPFHIALTRPRGSFEFTYAELGLGTTSVTAGMDMTFEDSYAQFCVHHYNQDGLIRAQ